MKTLTLCYRNYGKEILFDTIKESTEGKSKIEKDVIYFNDLNAMYKFMSPARAELLSVIKNDKPKSIYELSQKIHKDQGYVSKEIKFLNSLGIVDLIPDNSESRKKLIPIVKFDRIVFDVGIDDITYSKSSNE